MLMGRLIDEGCPLGKYGLTQAEAAIPHLCQKDALLEVNLFDKSDQKQIIFLTLLSFCF